MFTKAVFMFFENQDSQNFQAMSFCRKELRFMSFYRG